MINLPEAKRLYLLYTLKTGNINQLRGPHKKEARAAIMNAVTGKFSVANNHSGFHKVRDAMINLYGAIGNCDAAIDNDLSINARFQPQVAVDGVYPER